jgi:phage terminase large subunit-like protein
VKRALLGTPKGNGKTELLAAIALAELAGPKAPKSPNIPIAAASFEQADLLFGTARIMLTQGPLAKLFEVYDTEILIKDRPGRMYRVAAAAGTNDGGRPTCFIADELHEWTGNKERVHLVLSNSLAKRAEALELNISTAGSDENTLLGRMLTYAKRISSGEVIDPSFLVEWWAAADSHDLETDTGRRAALEQANPSAPAFVDIDRLLARASEVPMHEWQRYHLNRFVQPPDRWIGAEAWAKLADRERKLIPGERLSIGFDGSYARDATVITACTMDGHIFLIRAWEKSDTNRDPDWSSEIEDWTRRYGKRVAVFNTATIERMGPAVDRFFTAVATGEGLRHDGNPLLARHISNVHTRLTRFGQVLTKAYKASPDRIDAAISACVAFQGVKFLQVEPKSAAKVEWINL